MNYKFDAVKARDEVIEWIKERAKRDAFSKVVLGISGGKDSTVAAALCCRALGSENVHGLLMPNDIQVDIDDSIEVCKSLGIEYDTINIKPIYDVFLMQYMMCIRAKAEFKMVESTEEADETLNKFIKNYKEPMIEKPTGEAIVNLSPRIRMTLIRLWGQSHHHRLCGTGNLSEITVGYCTKDGDTSCDFNPLGGLTSIEVVEIGKTMDEIPLYLVEKTPADGLCGKTDEEKLGLSYIDIHNYIRKLDVSNDEVFKKIQEKELKNFHKRQPALVFIPSNKVLNA